MLPDDPPTQIRCESIPELMDLDGLYTPEKILLMTYTVGLKKVPLFLIRQYLCSFYLEGTKEVILEDILIYELENSPEEVQISENTQTLSTPESTTSSDATFTPPFDDIHLGNHQSR
ncbi:hypothetical protein B9Z55_012967 [Caenorhabditis nigoni]|nr:hypothetical protein B9Z55_012967 [Caenorhabditis nigoni]